MSKTNVAPAQAVDELAVNTIKFLSADGVEKAKSGHPGLPMGAADYTYVLWNRFLRYNPHDPEWPNRDRFILSGGHGSMLLYALLHLSGYDLAVEDLKRLGRDLERRSPLGTALVLSGCHGRCP